jgi:hypothetical protein
LQHWSESPHAESFWCGLTQPPSQQAKSAEQKKANADKWEAIVMGTKAKI